VRPCGAGHGCDPRSDDRRSFACVVYGFFKLSTASLLTNFKLSPSYRMSGIPILPALQTLKALIDSTVTSDHAALHIIFDPYTQLIPTDTWQEALVYTFARLTPVEAELMLLYARAHELGALLDKDLSRVPPIAYMERPPEAQGLHVQITVHDNEYLRSWVVRSVSMLREREAQRERYLAVLRSWVEEAWQTCAI